YVTKIDLHSENNTMDTIPLEVTDFNFDDEMIIVGRVGMDIEERTYQVNRDALLIEKDGTLLQIAPRDRQFQSASLLNRMLTNFGGPLNNFILAIVAFTLLAFVQGGVMSQEPLIGDVQADSPAAEIALEEGDRVLTIDGEEMDSWNQM